MRFPPLLLQWGNGLTPLPLRTVCNQLRLHPGIEVPPWINSGDSEQAFHFSDNMRLLCTDIAARFEPLAHLDISRMLFAFTEARNFRNHGLQARVTPMRFRDGAQVRLHRGIPFQVQQFMHEGREVRYIVTFCLPRFLNRSFDDKFVTIFHELFHIGPNFDGDLRRHKGRYSIHTACQKSYDLEMLAMARDYLQSGADPKLHSFLRLNFAQLRRRHGKVIGHSIPRPKLIPIPQHGADFFR
jgi:predicted metallopeptidase